MTVTNVVGSHPLFPRVSRVVASVLLEGLPPTPDPPSDPTDWTEAAEDLTRFRLSALALAVAHKAEIDLSPDTRLRLQKAQRLDASLSMQAEAAALEVFSLLEDEAVPFLVNKGPATARFHPDPNLRPYRDIDVLVPPRLFDRALRLLKKTGFVDLDEKVQPRGFFSRYCREGVNLSGGKGSLDLHHVIPPWIWGRRLTFDVLVQTCEEIKIGARQVPAVGRVDGLLATALHLLSDRLHPGRELMIWRDVLAILQHISSADIASRARESRLAGVLRFILSQVPPSHQPRALLEELKDAELSKSDATRLRKLVSTRASGHQLAYFYRLPLTNSIAFAAGYLFPARRFLRERYGAKGGQLMRWWVDVFRSVPPA